MTNQIKIIVDDREQAVIPYFNEYKTHPNITYCVQRINIGDYSIVYKEYILMIIERKSWKDLAASIKDGRKDNVEKLLKLRRDVGCQIFYLIEGNPMPKATVKFCRVPYKNLRSHLDHLIMRDNIHIIQSKNQENTVERIFELVKNYLTIKPSLLKKYDDLEIKDGKIKEGGAIEKLKEKTEVSAESIIYKIWCCLPNIAEKTASLFINKGYHIADLILGNITKDQIYALKYNNGNVIGTLSTKIWNGSRIKDINTKYFVKMLTQINGITKKTADIILNNISFECLLKGEITVETLININKTSNKKLGQKVSNQILKYLSPLDVLSTDENNDIENTSDH